MSELPTMFPLDDTDIVAFWRDVARPITANPSVCWEWRGPYNDHGIGEFRRRRIKWRAHKLATFLLFGWVPDEHARPHWICDNRRCVNPYHLRYDGPQRAGSE